jgi:hypothetical protein
VLGDRAGARERLEWYLGQRPSLRAFVARDPMWRGLLTERTASAPP